MRVGDAVRPARTIPENDQSRLLDGSSGGESDNCRGRIIVDEPTDLPEGAELDLVVVGNDDLDEEDELALLASLDRALDDEDAGRTVNVDEFLAEVRAQT
ncbi:MAG TPA: hypothetical protein VIV60_22970 [Polyangiaceae bacterium]